MVVSKRTLQARGLRIVVGFLFHILTIANYG
jgi:hypothetical protein